MKFFLGTHQVSWLGRLAVPLFVSHRRLAGRRALPRAAAPWALDSGGFTELSMFGAWQTSPADYVAAARRYSAEIGMLAWAAPQDWMCEPSILARTGLTVAAHQQRTVENYLRLRALAPEVPFVPVVQGWTLPDYQRCADAYTAAGVDLTAEATVGLGSVCRRQHTAQIEQVVRAMHARGLRLHGFGVKTAGLTRYAHQLTSADSMAWSYRARRAGRQPGCTHATCANCPRYALAWRDRTLTALTYRQYTIDDVLDGAA